MEQPQAKLMPHASVLRPLNTHLLLRGLDTEPGVCFGFPARPEPELTAQRRLVEEQESAEPG
jgi:hypothetical protein